MDCFVGDLHQEAERNPSQGAKRTYNKVLNDMGRRGVTPAVGSSFYTTKSTINQQRMNKYFSIFYISQNI